MEQEIIYTLQGSQIFCGKRKIAQVEITYKGKFIVTLLQGMPQKQVIERIKAQLPDFAAKHNLDENNRYGIFTK